MINADFLKGFWQGLVMPMQILRYILLFPIAVIGSLFCIIFSPVLALFVNGSGDLPWWLKFAQTPDAPACGDEMWGQNNPTYSHYWLCVTWLARNPFYGGLQWLGVPSTGGYYGYGNIYCDSSNSLGAAFLTSKYGFQINIVWKFPLVSWCVIRSFGWNIKATGKTAGAYILAPIRFYNYTGS